MISFTFMKQLLFSAKLAAVRLRRVAEFILVRGIMRATLVTFSSISIALAYSQEAPAPIEKAGLWSLVSRRSGS